MKTRCLISQRLGRVPVILALGFLLTGCSGEDPKTTVPQVKSASELGQDLRSSDSVPDLIEATKHNESLVRLAAIDRLKELGPRAALAFRILGDVLKNDPDEAVRRRALETISAAGPAAKDAVPGLLAELSRANNDSRRRVVETLGAMGPAADEAIPDLVELRLAQPSDSSVEEAIAKIDPSREKQLPRYIAVLEGATLDNRVKKATDVLVSFGETAVPHLCKILIDSKETASRQAALEALRRIGDYSPTVLQALAEAAGDESKELRRDAIRILADAAPPVKEALPTLRLEAMRPSGGSLDSGRRENALKAIAKLGSDAAPAVPDLEELVERQDEESVACEALRTLGVVEPTKLRLVIQALKDSRPKVRVAAAEIVAKIGPDAKDALPGLAGALRFDSEESVVRAALKAMGAMGNEAAPYVMEISRKVQANQGNEVHQTALAVEKQIAPHAVAVLGEALAGEQLEDQRAAASSLRRLGKSAAPAQAQIILALKSSDSEVRFAAADALGLLEEQASPQAVEALASVLTNGPANLRLTVVRSLGKIGRPNASSAQQALLAILQAPDKTSGISAEAAETLVRITDDPATLAQALEALRKALVNDDIRVAEAAARGLGHFGAKAAPAVPDLLKAAARMKNQADNSARGALLKIGPDAIPALTEALNQPDDTVHEHATIVLARLGGDDILLQRLGHADAAVRRSTALKLGAVGSKTKATAQALEKLRDDPDPSVRNAVAYALGRMNLKAIVPPAVLLEAVADEDPQVRRWAITAMALSKPAAKDAVPLLVIAWVLETDDHKRVETAKLLQKLSPAPGGMKSPSQTGSEWEVGGLDGLGAAASPAVPRLISLLTPPKQAPPSPSPSPPKRRSSLSSSDPDPRAGVCGRAAHALGLIGRDAKTAAPALAELLFHPAFYERTYLRPKILNRQLTEENRKIQFVRNDVREALIRLGPAASPLLSPGLKAGEPAIRLRTTYAISLIDDANSAASVLPLLSDPDMGVRIMAAQTLGKLGKSHLKFLTALSPGGAVGDIESSNKEIIAGLAKTVADSDPAMSVASLEALTGFGPAARPAAAEMKVALKNTNATIRFAAAKALMAVDRSHAQEAVPALIEGLKIDPDGAAKILATLGSEAKAAVPEMAKQLLATKVGSTRDALIGALGELGQHAKEALPALETVMSRSSEFTNDLERDFEVKRSRLAAYEAALRIDPVAVGRMPSAKQVLEIRSEEEKSNREAYEAARRASRKIGP